MGCLQSPSGVPTQAEHLAEEVAASQDTCGKGAMEEQNPSPQSPKERHQLRDRGRGQQEDGTRCISTLPRKLPPSHTSSSSRPQLQQPRGGQGRSLHRLTLPRSSQGRSLTRLTSRSSQGRSLTRLTSSRSTLSSAGTESRLSSDEGGREQGPQGRKSRPGGSLQPAILASRAAARGQHRPVRSRRGCSGPVGPQPASTRKPVPDPQRKASHRVDQEAQTETWAQEVDLAVQYAEQETQTDTVAEEEKNSAAPLMVDQETETETPIQEKNSASPQITDEWTQTKAHSSAPSTGTEALAHRQPPSLSCRVFWRCCMAGQPHGASALQNLRDSRSSRQPLRPEHSTPEKWGWTALPPYSWPWLIEMNQF
ncbi:uncharacterized protein LOC132333626 [Haemorhous mexicanus]|uniref:uncharacterized protein LOC132333626 n=1 Tax=Haemorhous mexicanus TaxID=30427 RepID=UPI0028BE4458|nr:uncharacterized protein LOC132333626 [Haemorhous mexicanus]